MATGAPGTNGVWQYGEDDSEATFSALLNKTASTADTQIGLDRARLTTLEARKLSGIVPIIPTSVSVGSGSGSYNSTTGLVTFTGASAITVNGVFSTTYKNYRIVAESSTASAAAAVMFRFASAGTGTSSSLWYGAGAYYGVNGSGNITPVNGAAEMYCWGLTSTGFANISTNAEITVSNNRMNVIAGGFPNNAGGSQITAMYNIASMSSLDGFKLMTSSGNFTGTLKVYGWN